MNIESSLVGLIIGRGGETLRRVEQETGARVQFLTNGQDRDSGGERVCNIQGNRVQIAAARRAIETIIAENGPSGGGAGGPTRGGGGKFGGGGGGGGGGGVGAGAGAGAGGSGGGQPNLRDGGWSNFHGSMSNSSGELAQCFFFPFFYIPSYSLFFSRKAFLAEVFWGVYCKLH